MKRIEIKPNSPDYWKPEHTGLSIIGIFRGVSKSLYGEDMIIINEEKKKLYYVAINYCLDKFIDTMTKGEKYEIVFTGFREFENGSGREFKVYHYTED